jgi:hypothetical protein
MAASAPQEIEDELDEPREVRRPRYLHQGDAAQNGAIPSRDVGIRWRPRFAVEIEGTEVLVVERQGREGFAHLDGADAHLPLAAAPAQKDQGPEASARSTAPGP